MSKPTVYAHRGASAVRFENTMAAFKKAYRLGADGIEIDIQLTEDGIPLVIHDLDLLRLAGIRKVITAMTSKEISRIRVGRKYRRLFFGSRIPTLLDIVLFCQSHHLKLNVELKESILENPDSLTDILPLLSILDDVHISSFHYTLVEKVKSIEPHMETALLIRKKEVDWDCLDKYTDADAFHFHKRLLKEPFLSKLIATRKKIRIYGVTGKEMIVKNPPSYINGWITDYPDRFSTEKDRI